MTEQVIQWKGTYSSTKQVLEFMGQKVCTRTQVAQDKFHEYADSASKNGLHVSTEFGEVRITKGTWVIKESDGTLTVCADRFFKQIYPQHITEV